MVSVVPRCVQQLETQGYAIISEALSDRLITLLTRISSRAPEFQLIRQVFEGLPKRVVETLVGPVILSMARYGVPAGWHRGRSDTMEAGAPVGFTPGYDVGLMLDRQPCAIEVARGSFRLAPEAVAPSGAIARIELGPADVVVLDTRTLRCWPVARQDQVFWFSVVRPWISPLMNFHDSLPQDTPPRAREFAGRRPARDVADWLFATHSKRSN